MAINNHDTIPCEIIRTVMGGFLVEIQFQGQVVIPRRLVVRTATGWGVIREKVGVDVRNNVGN